MFILSAFADEIDPDPEKQIEVLRQCGIRHIELRSILLTNVLDLTGLQCQEMKSLLQRAGFGLSAIGSPIGKVAIDQPFGPHLERFKHALKVCQFFETPRMRIFSYYLGEGGEWDDWRRELMDRFWQKIELAQKAGVTLLHENEHRIFGESPKNVADLMDTVLAQVDGPWLQAVYDPANYVYGGHDPWEAWEMTREWTTHFHIKDWIQGEKHGRVAGEGHGQIERVMRDAVARGYNGFATLEPHLLGGDAKGGSTGPDLFPKAASAFKTILERVGAKYS